MDGKPLTDHEKLQQSERLLREVFQDCSRMSGDIHGLLAEVAALRERLRWRDVADDLPDEYTDVLVARIQDSVGSRFVVEAYMHRDIDGVIWWRRNGQVIPAPTHWQPMPDAPEPQITER